MHGTGRPKLTSWVTKVKLEQSRNPNDAGDADTGRTLAGPESVGILSFRGFLTSHREKIPQ